jgi:hypothetical protein
MFVPPILTAKEFSSPVLDKLFHNPSVFTKKKKKLKLNKLIWKCIKKNFA